MTRMERLFVAGLTGLLVSVFTLPATSTSRAQEPACLHDGNDVPEQLARRRAAIGFARQVNTLQVNLFAKTGAYVPLAKLPLSTPAPDGWKVILSADPASYSFSIVDTTDPCKFGLFSNHEGLIYRGEAMR